MTKSDVWEAVRKYGGVSVQYGEADIYELIMPGEGNKCCIVVGTVDESAKRIAKTISDKCFVVRNKKSLESVILKMGGIYYEE